MLNFKYRNRAFIERIKKNKLSIIIVGFIFVIGTLLRINGLGFGLPLRLHPDEMYVIEPAVRVASTGKFDPGIYNRPSHVSIYLDAFSFKLFSILRCSLFDTCGTVQDLFNSSQTFYVFLARSLVAIMGSLMILIMYFLGNEINGKKLGMLCAIITAFFPSFILHSHFAAPDIPLTLFISICALFVCRYIRTKMVIYLLIGCFFCGLATAEKYTGFFATMIILFGILCTNWLNMKSILKLGCFALLTYLLSIFVSAPFLLLKYKEVIEALTFESNVYNLGAVRMIEEGSLLFYFRQFYKNVGILLLTIFFFSIFIFIIKFGQYIKTKKYIMIFIFGLTFWLFLSRLTIHWERWILPLHITLIIITSVGVIELLKIIKLWQDKKVIYYASLLVVLIIPLVSLILNGLAHSVRFNIPDTRVVAKQWMEVNIPKEAKLAYDGYTPPYPCCPLQVASEKTLEEFKQEDVEYVIVSSMIYKRILLENGRYPEMFGKEAEFYKKLFSEEELIIQFPESEIINFESYELDNLSNRVLWLFDYLQEGDGYLIGPQIKIYKLNHNS